MNKEVLYQVTKIGAIIPWALLVYPLHDGATSISFLLFQFMCWDLMLRYERNN